MGGGLTGVMRGEVEALTRRMSVVMCLTRLNCAISDRST